jgi:hypothetical protein
LAEDWRTVAADGKRHELAQSQPIKVPISRFDF